MLRLNYEEKIRNLNESTTPAGIRFCFYNLKGVRPPLLQKEGKYIRHIFKTLHSILC
jgi:hypothetical protein